MGVSDQFVRIGQVLKSNGTNGQVLVGLAPEAPEELNLNEPVFIFFDGLPVPFFVEDLAVRSATKLLVRLTDIASFDDAEEIVGKSVFIASCGDGGENSDFIGWTVVDTSNNLPVGEVSGIEDIPGNPCLEIGEILIPFHEDLVEEIDKRHRIIRIAVPSGLIH